MKTKEDFMKDAIKQAHKALKADEVPIGCVIVKDNKVIARGWNEREKKQISCSHAEVEAIQKACKKLGTWRLEDCDLYVTLEPCPMCAGAIIQSRIRNVYFGAYDPKGGAAGSVTNLFEIEKWNHHPYYEGGILQEECSAMLTNFFQEKRKIQKEKKRLAKIQAMLEKSEHEQDMQRIDHQENVSISNLSDKQEAIRENTDRIKEKLPCCCHDHKSTTEKDGDDPQS